MNRWKQKEAGNRGWRPAARCVVSLLLLWHLAAVFVPPFTFQTSPIRGLGSPLAESAMGILGPYIDLVYLNHGYAFFAPDPGSSHLLQARLEFDDGREPVETTMPDLEQHWPRLLYHRYFMLSEHLNGAFVPPEAPAEIGSGPEAQGEWRWVRKMYEARRAAIESHLLNRWGADRVTMRRIEHRLLEPYEFVTLGKRIEAPDTYVELTEEATDEAEE